MQNRESHDLFVRVDRYGRGAVQVGAHETQTGVVPTLQQTGQFPVEQTGVQQPCRAVRRTVC